MAPGHPQPADLKRGRLPAVLAAAMILVALLSAFWFNRPRPGIQVTIRADGRETVLITKATTIGQALAEAGVPMSPVDRSIPPVTSPLTASTTVSVIRVVYTQETRQEPIPHPRLVLEDPRLPKGYRQIVAGGADGVKQVTETITLENGVEVARHIVGERVLVEPQPERVVSGTRDDAALSVFYTGAVNYLGRGGVTRLSVSVVEQTLFELARLGGDRYGSVRVLSRNGRPWLVVQTFSRAPAEAVLLVFWWSDELNAFGQILSDRLSVQDARAQQTEKGIELGIIAAPEQASEAQAPQFLLYRLPTKVTTQGQLQADTWQLLWSSQTQPDWRSNQGAVAFSGSGLDRLTVTGTSYLLPESPAGPISECQTCPHRRFESTWQRSGDAYSLASHHLVPTPYATLWLFLDSLRKGDVAAASALVSDTSVITLALQMGLGEREQTWTTAGRDSDLAFDLIGSRSSLRIELTPRGQGWLVSALGPVRGRGRILFTATRPVVRGLYDTDPSAAAPPRNLGDAQRYVWSPDYSRIAYEWQGQIYVMNSDGSQRQLIGTGAAPAWSADGQRLAFEQMGSGGTTIVVSNVAEPRVVPVAAGSRPTWLQGTTASGQRLVYSHSTQAGGAAALFVIEERGGTPLLFASDGRDPLASPDGSAVAFLTSRGEITVVLLGASLADSRVTTVAQGWGYTWSPDGQSLAFITMSPAGRPMIWNRGTGETRTLVDVDDVDGITWSPEGTDVVLARATSGELWIVTADGGDLRKLTNGRDPVWAWTPRAGR